jgi:hypothetical protein
MPWEPIARRALKAGARHARTILVTLVVIPRLGELDQVTADDESRSLKSEAVVR